MNVYEPNASRWSRGKDIPVAVDSAVAGVTHNRFVYLIGGRSPNGPVNNVQVYDLEKDSWSQATPFPGTPVFGLSGGVADEDHRDRRWRQSRPGGWSALRSLRRMLAGQDR